jgi:N6-L-threonylcarbamoyladenine synthase
MIEENNFDFSFAGLKTSVVNLVKSSSFVIGREGAKISEIAYEFQEAIVEVLVKKTLRAAKVFGAKSIVVGGGVGANSRLKKQMFDAGQKASLKVFLPPKNLSTDNGAMIASAAYFSGQLADPLKLQADPGLHF